MASIKITGIKELEKQLKENYTLNDVKRAIRTNGAQLQTKIQQKADFKGHYEWEKGVGKVFVPATGDTKRSVMLDISLDGMSAESGPTTHYAEYLEYGTRFMEAQPFVEPALEEQARKFKNDLNKLVR